MPRLPIDDVLQDVARALHDAHRVVVEAPPGAGKTTRIPPFLLDGDLAPQGDIVVVEPRRLAARLAARHVASERGEPVGATVGYQVRFESVAGATTRVRYVTEGVFIRQLLSDPKLQGVAVVVLDEFHERHLHGDLALSWLRALQQTTRPELHIVVMSATLDTASIASFLDPCPVVRAQGRRFDVEVSYSNRPDDRPLHLRVASAVRTFASGGLDGDVLVFLPGAAEIRKANEACERMAHDLGFELVSLHGNLPPEEQDRALAPRPRPKVILSTNVAESSVTIDGVVAVIDSGLARVASHAPWSGLSTLRVAPISKASAAQRTGRAGRTRPGRCLRMYSDADWSRRPEHDSAEIQRADLTETALTLRGLGPVDGFRWFEAPNPSAWSAADALLAQLGALGRDGSLTEIGRRLLRFPVHPRVGRILVEAERRGVTRRGATLAALIGERDLALGKRTVASTTRGDEPMSTDLLDALDLFEEAADARFAGGRLRAMGVDARVARDVDKARRQLRSACKPVGECSQAGPAEEEEKLRICVLTGYPDRVARRVRGRDVALVGGGSATVASSEQEQVPEFMVAVDAEERRDGRSRRLVVRSICRIEPEWLLELFADEIGESEEHRFNAERGCVESVERLTYRNLVLDESRGRAAESTAAAQVLATEALALGVHAFAPKDALDSLLGRVAFVREACPDAGLAPLDKAAVEAALRALCHGRRCLDELREAGLIEVLKGAMPHDHRQAIERLAPETVRLPGGRLLPIHYEAGKPPWASSRLQDFFGMVDGPRLANGRVAVVLHLLAPNKRAVQVTSDLAGFWDKHYPSLRRQLCRRYPKHAWPEDGRSARPPAPGKLR